MNNSNKNETIISVIFTILLIILISIIVYNAYESNNSLKNNTVNLKPNNIQNVDIYNNSSKVKPPTTIETKIASFSSNIYDQDENRVHNITLAISKINETIIKEGEVFSFNNTVGPMGADQGFKEAIGFDSNGKNIKMLGGGMCQISSTLYNAALIANLEIIERHPHSKRVYYVPKDKDATIYYGVLDLKFKNTTENDIKIIATNDDSNVTIILNKITSGN